jgi:hypothetical protein
MNGKRPADDIDHIRRAATDASGFIDIDFDVVWETVETALPAVLEHLPASANASGDDNGGNHA